MSQIFLFDIGNNTTVPPHIAPFFGVNRVFLVALRNNI